MYPSVTKSIQMNIKVCRIALHHFQYYHYNTHIQSSCAQVLKRLLVQDELFSLCTWLAFLLTKLNKVHRSNSQHVYQKVKG